MGPHWRSIHIPPLFKALGLTLLLRLLVQEMLVGGEGDAGICRSVQFVSVSAVPASLRCAAPNILFAVAYAVFWC